tara:strand:+ start:106 stop:441 length:336 start_codon:yes stop_codon:yes gene_type:complete
MSKPLIVSYTSDYGVASDSYHVVERVDYNKSLSPNTTVSASIYLDKSSYQSSSTPLSNYSFKFNMDVEIINNPISQSYEVLKTFDNPNADSLTGDDGSLFFIDFSTSTQDI